MRADPSSEAPGRTVDAIEEIAPLVRAARSGDRAAFGVLYERYARLVHGILLAHAERDDVQDLVHEVFLRALRQLHALRDESAFGGWLATIARNEARMHHRGARQLVELSEQIPAEAPSSPVLGTDEVLLALRSLPERYREPLTLRLVEEMTGEEIAHLTGLTHGTVRVYLHHGLRLLRDRLGKAHD
jgi:RNA polymerase sigma-70 factor (ECF subfamily)